MGRRKIEIQPITHERNRSVTFLKRKNGLFKKAYELGVLCSVDVAVIIFEERPGHEVKFHSYSSCDLRDIVQRQIRFQGDRDSRGPADFSGAGGGRYDEDGDENDDEEDDESNRRTSKRKISKLGMQPDMGASDVPDYLPPVPRNGLPHLAMGGGGHYDDASTTSIGSLMPISNDRVSSLRSSTRGSKRQRTNESGLSNTGGRMSTRGHSTHVHAHDEPGPPGMMLQHGPQHLYGPNAPGYGSPQQYGQIFPLGGPGGPMNMGPPPGPIPPLPPRFEPQYDPALYQHQYPHGIIRQASAPGQGSRNDGGNVSEHRDGQPLNGSQRERGGGEMFAAFLEADERSRQMAAAAAAAQRQHQDQLNWPTSTSSPNTPSTPPTIHPNQPGTSGNAPPNSGNWFDIFGAGSAPNPAPEGTNMPWSRINNVNINDDIVRILSSDTAGQQPGGPVVSPPPAAADHPDDSSIGNPGNGDSANTKEGTIAPVAQSKEEAADEAEAEKDAEGEDEDVDGGGDKKVDATASGAAMAVDPPPSFTKNGSEEADSKQENQGDGVEQGDGDTVMSKSKPGRGRPKKATSGSRGKGKAKG